MTTAKSQQMPNSSDSPDDLIAELAKLMAQDAQGAPAPAKPPAPQPAAPLTFRIPGSDTPVVVPANARGASPEAQSHQASNGVQRPVQHGPAAPAQMRRHSDATPTAQPASEAGHFDFGFSPKVDAREPVATPKAEIIPPQPVSPHDAIAELIAAEFAEVRAAHARQNTGESAAEAPAPLPAPEPARKVEARVQEASRPEAPRLVVAQEPVASQPHRDEPAVSRPGNVRPMLRQVNVSTAAKPEADKFVISPVFGLGSGKSVEAVTPPVRPEQPPVPGRVEPTLARELPSEPRRASNPMAEIESLIGEAVRVQLDPTPPRAPQARPAAIPPRVPAARKAREQEAERAAEEAILLAAATTGANVGIVDEFADDEDEAPTRKGRRAKAPKATRSRSFRSYAGPLVALTLLLAAGFGLFWVLNMERPAGSVPVLTADTSPIRETVAAAPDASNAQRSIVFDEIDGVAPPEGGEQLVSRDQAETEEVAALPAAPVVEEAGLANRRVRTVTVRPDGTIVSGEGTLAGSELLPVERPNVPEVPSTGVDATDLLAAASAGAPVSSDPLTGSTNALVDPAATAPVTAVIAPTGPPRTAVPAMDEAGNLTGQQAPYPMPRPGFRTNGASLDRPANQVSAVMSSPEVALTDLPGAPEPPPENARNSDLIGNLAAAQPAALVREVELEPAPAVLAMPLAQAAVPAETIQDPIEAAVAPAAVEEDVAAVAPRAEEASVWTNFVQLSSQRSEAAADQSRRVLQSQFGSLFGGTEMQIKRVDLGERGIYYRVLLPTTSRQGANSICSDVKAAGGDCLTL